MDLLAAFRYHLVDDLGRADETAKGYLSLLRPLLRDHDPLTIDFLELAAYRSEGVSVSAKRHRAAACRSFFAWLHAEGYRDDNPAAKLKLPANKQGLPRDVDEATILKVAKMAKWEGPRHHALCCLLQFQGLRISEACGLRRAQVAPGWLTGIGTKTQPRNIPLVDVTADALAALDHDGPWVLPAPRDPSRPMSRHTAYQWVHRWCRHAHVAPFNPHRFRDTFATTALANGVSIFHLQRILGHANLAQTQKYARVRDRDLPGEMAKVRYKGA